VTLSYESEEEEAPEQEKFLAFMAPHVKEENSYYSEHSDEDGKELKEAYKTLYVEFEKLREARKQHIHELNKKLIVAQDTRTRGEATRDTTTVGEGHR